METLLKTITMPADIDASGQVPTGWLLARMDLAGAVLPGRHFGVPVQLVGLSDVVLSGRPRLRQSITFRGRVASADGHAVVVWVEAFSEERGQVGEALLLNAQLRYTAAVVDVPGNIFPGVSEAWLWGWACCSSFFGACFEGGSRDVRAYQIFCVRGVNTSPIDPASMKLNQAAYRTGSCWKYLRMRSG